MKRLYVRPEFRGKGWGRRLLGQLLAQARALGLRELILDAQSTAVAFYEPLGFLPEGEEFMDAGIPHRHMKKRNHQFD